MAIAELTGMTGGKDKNNMNNSQIIMNEAIESGYCTPEEVEQLVADGKDTPFHTFAAWKKQGHVPKEGSHGWETRLWRKKKLNPSDKADSEIKNQGFFLQKSFLFHMSQCEALKETGNRNEDKEVMV